MKDNNSIGGRRKLLKSIVAGSGVVISGKSLPDSWIRPVVDSVMLPAHAQTSQIAGYQFVGSWIVSDGPSWNVAGNPAYTGQEAAALLFGGNPSDYRISTVDNQVANINDSAWMDGWNDDVTYGTSGNPAAHDFKVDLAPPGTNLPGSFGAYYSAYVSDHSLNLENFAFRLVP